MDLIEVIRRTIIHGSFVLFPEAWRSCLTFSMKVQTRSAV
jgi:hypothetical protein